MEGRQRTPPWSILGVSATDHHAFLQVGWTHHRRWKPARDEEKAHQLASAILLGENPENGAPVPLGMALRMKKNYRETTHAPFLLARDESGCCRSLGQVSVYQKCHRAQYGR